MSYLSCSAGSLSRDLAELEDCGLRVAALQPYDFFPQTHHVEVLALLGVGSAAAHRSP
jgi:tRNA/tmRNA/rRNA uracil-C5-methylase (TrmA/RlmC/RlmD family)